MKYFIFSIDDGTIYDQKVIEIFNRYGIRGTFNLNSGLSDFVWYKDGRPVERLKLSENIALYDGHEVASHSLTHPHLTQMSDDGIGYEVGVDLENLSRLFSRPVLSFAFPFEDFDDRCINRIKDMGIVKAIRVSEIDPSFAFPVDPFHIKITSLDVKEALSKADDFIASSSAKLFVFVSHSYDFEFDNTYDELEKLCKKVANCSEIAVITTKELPSAMKRN